MAHRSSSDARCLQLIDEIAGRLNRCTLEDPKYAPYVRTVSASLEQLHSEFTNINVHTAIGYVRAIRVALDAILGAVDRTIRKKPVTRTINMVAELHAELEKERHRLAATDHSGGCGRETLFVCALIWLMFHIAMGA